MPILQYRDLTFAEKLTKASIPVRNTLTWRALAELPRRLWGELLLGKSRPVEFRYHRLEPNLEEYVYTDCDAFTAMDPHAAILVFKSRGWEILSHPTRKARLLARHEPVVVRKPNGSPEMS